MDNCDLQNSSPGIIKKIIPGHSGDVATISWSLDGKHIVSGSEDKTLKIWDASTYECIKTLQGHNGYIYSV